MKSPACVRHEWDVPTCLQDLNNYFTEYTFKGESDPLEKQTQESFQHNFTGTVPESDYRELLCLC